MVLSADIATLIGFACEAVLYGLYIVLFFLSLTFLVWRRRSRDMNVPMVAASCTLFLLCSTHFAIQFNHFYTHLSTAGVSHFSGETLALGVGDFILSVADFVGDLVLIYRCWLVWGENHYIIIIPLLTALGGFVCGMVTLHLIVAIGLNHQQPPAALVHLGTALFSLPLCTNVIVTALIVGRIFYLAQPPAMVEMQKQTRTLVWNAAGIVIESGMLYLVAQLVLVVLFAIKNPAYKVVGYPIIQIYGIAPTLIFCRVGMGASIEQTFNNNTTGAGSFGFRVQSRSHHTGRFGSTGTSGLSSGTAAHPSTTRLGKDKDDVAEDFEMPFTMIPIGARKDASHNDSLGLSSDV